MVAILQDPKLQLVEYEWQVLPIERLKLTIITDRAKKEIVYGF